MSEPDYKKFMRAAIDEAEKGRFETYPNPAVGALLVRDGDIVAIGYHKGPGLPHAEIECLNDAASRGINPSGCTLIVTLEPCRHHGKTPPCTDAIMAAGITKLVYGCVDPNPEAAGGAAILAEKGLEVIGPVLQQACEDLIADFRVWQTTTRPYILLKLACTLDGRIATRNGNSRWITSPESRQVVHRLRRDIGKAGGAILIGGGTFRSDNPHLSARLENESIERQPLACILTSRLPKATADVNLLKERPSDTIFFASPAATASTTAEALRKLGCRIFALGPTLHGEPNLGKLFTQLREELNCPYVLCEGGGKLAFSLLKDNFVDEFHLHMAPKILGDNEAKPLFSGNAPASLDEALHMRFCSAKLHHDDVHLLLRPKS